MTQNNTLNKVRVAATELAQLISMLLLLLYCFLDKINKYDDDDDEATAS